jgi:hypothetical protein
VIVTGINGIVAVVVGKNGFARISTLPDQRTKCVPAGAAAAVTVTSVPDSSPLAVPLFTVNPAIDPEKAIAANAIATKNILVGLLIIIFALVIRAARINVTRELMRQTGLLLGSALLLSVEPKTNRIKDGPHT